MQAPWHRRPGRRGGHDEVNMMIQCYLGEARTKITLLFHVSESGRKWRKSVRPPTNPVLHRAIFPLGHLGDSVAVLEQGRDGVGVRPGDARQRGPRRVVCANRACSTRDG